MNRVATLVPLLSLFIWTSQSWALQKTTQPAVPKVSFADRVEQIARPPKPACRDAVRSTIRDFKDGVQQTRFVDDLSIADYALDRFTFGKRNGATHLKAQFKRRAGAQRGVASRGCVHCDANAVEPMVYELLSLSLLDPADGLYLPLELKRCQNGNPYVKLTLDGTHAASLQTMFRYVVGVRAMVNGQNGWKAIGPRLALVGDTPSTALSTFRIEDTGALVRAFRDNHCAGLPKARLALMPLLPVISQGRVNSNASSGTR